MFGRVVLRVQTKNRVRGLVSLCYFLSAIQAQKLPKISIKSLKSTSRSKTHFFLKSH